MAQEEAALARSRCEMMVHEDNGQTESSFSERLLALTPSLYPLAERLEEAAASDLPVLLIGASGTGKTYLARLLHHFSPRGEQPFVVAPCGSLAPNLLMSALFGQAQDTSEGADGRCVGRLEAAGSGAILLKDIDALPTEGQNALLRVIETGNYEPVGSEEMRLCRARILATAKRDIRQSIVEKRFRGDLYYAFHQFSFYLPPLRQRRQDIAPLARALVNSAAKQFRKKPPLLLPQTLRVLRSFPWPGNIRQLETSIQHAVLVSSEDELRVEDLPQELLEFSDR
jgi:two-component system response regulator HydG